MINRISNRWILAATRLGVLASLLLGPSWSRADEPPAHHRRMENRFLFVIDTSSAMKSRTNGLAEAVVGLLDSGMKGELRKGDTIGLWTYSDRLSTDFPMQVWSEQKKDDIADRVREHLGILVLEGRSHLDKAWPAIQQVATASERLTVILINDGADSIKGTPYDREINKLERQYAREFRSAHQAFITILAARDGKFFDYGIYHPDSITIPQMADPLPPPETNEPPPVVVAPLPSPPAVTNPPAARIQINLSGHSHPQQGTTPPPAEPSVVAEAVPVPVPAPEPAAAVATNTSPVTPAAPVAVEVPQTAPVASTNLTPPTPVSAPPPGASAPPAAPANTATVAPDASLPPSAPSPPAGVPVAPAVVATSSFQQVAVTVMAISLLTIAVALVVLLIWRWRDRSHPSLISQSIDRSR